VAEKVVAAMNKLLSKTPSGPSAAEPLVTVCAAESSFDHVTVPPTSIVTSAGIKHSLVSSHPGTDVPAGALTDAVSAANAEGVAAILATIAKSVYRISLH